MMHVIAPQAAALRFLVNRRTCLLLPSLMLAGKPGPAQAQTGRPPWRVGASPDEWPLDQARQFPALGRWLESHSGSGVEWVALPSRATLAEALLSKQVDMVWWSALDGVYAEARWGAGRLLPLVQREEDSTGRMVFIADARRSIERLGDLRGRSFSFGAQHSASGHWLARALLKTARIHPDSDLRRLNYSGSHEATVNLVQSGKVEAGVVDGAVWDRLLTEGKIDPQALRVIHTAATGPDWHWVIRADTPAEQAERLLASFVALTPEQPRAREALEAQRTRRFVPVRQDDFQALRQAVALAGPGR